MASTLADPGDDGARSRDTPTVLFRIAADRIGRPGHLRLSSARCGSDRAIGCLFLAVTVQIEDYIGPMTVVALVVLGSVTLLSVVLCVMLQRAASRYRRVLAVAEAAQLALLRPLPDRIGSLRMAGFYRAADDEALIGGDLYSVRPTPFGVRAIVGDVKGKGINATQTVATVISTFQEAALLHPTLPQVADRIDVALQLDRDNPPPEPVSHTQPEHSADDAKGLVDELFTTAVLLEFTSDARTVQVLDRGHQPLLIVRRHTTSVVPAEHSLPLGMADLLTEPPGTTACRLEPGDILLAYSDGVTEARDSTGTFYPLPERLRHHYATSAQPVSPSDLISFLQEDVTRWAHTLGDDVIAIAFQRI
ncbi:PP2C family protein-serine/threonine phosphatase [Streptomyces anthocyanicus]|uniref:PP2C family protein-serine/threonine phosphatase n=1 Tax=Streptomyces anthocyanicus TaxID=68174 RepID=UPI00216ACCA5|nr:PP2C family protein-serine/threonine phosphatase [Streptomyces anthocyanicus]